MRRSFAHTENDANILMKRLIDWVALRDFSVTTIPLAVLIVGSFWFAFQFVRPAPSDRLVITTGPEGGAYEAHAKRYRDIIARNRVQVELRPSSGSVENLQRLATDPTIDAALVQSGVAESSQKEGLVSLGSVYPEPLWVFYRGEENLERIAQLKGKHLAIGPEGSGVRALAQRLLSAHGIGKDAATLLDLPIGESAGAMGRGEIDVAFIVAGAESPVVQELLRLEGVRLMSMTQAASYTRLFPFLSSVTLPRGVIDLVRDIPTHDTTLLAANANLVARKDLHPALTSLLIQAAIEVHNPAGLFHGTGEFPSAAASEFRLSEEAVRHYKSGPPFLQRYLPFWLAVFVERMVVLVVPLIVVLIPVMRFLPSIYSWRVKRRVYRWYGELKQLEHDVEQPHEPEKISEFLTRLENIEDRASQVKVPLAFADLLYNLRLHIQLVRALIRTKERNGLDSR
jgi:TRAP transporter TAXI family solute receptor